MRIGAQDVQVLSPHDPDIEALELALDAAEEAYVAAREEKVTEADEKQLQAAIDAVQADWDELHGLTELAEKVAAAKAAVDEVYDQFHEEGVA